MLRIFCIAATAAMSTPAIADLVIDESTGATLDLTASAGSGEFTAYVVIDFEHTGGGSFAFSYSFDGEATVHDALFALVDQGLDYAFDDFGEWGIFAVNFGWGGAVGDAQNYWAHSLVTPDGSGTVDWSDAMSSVDTTWLSDGLLSGWYNGFNDDYSAITPSLPLTVPTPGAIGLIGLLVIGSRRRR
ncbi:MAG: hypothetical protein MK101_06760 [Phycisphaerales bacterium]|nr:hypothetical protein [Phycisphaerales bacterium]